MAKLNKDTMAYKNKVKYIHQYCKNCSRVYLLLNPATESDLIEWLKDKKKATYVKQLIRNDMNAHKN